MFQNHDFLCLPIHHFLQFTDVHAYHGFDKQGSIFLFSQARVVREGFFFSFFFYHFRMIRSAKPFIVRVRDLEDIFSRTIRKRRVTQAVKKVGLKFQANNMDEDTR